MNEVAKFDQLKNVPKIWSFWFLIGSTGTNEVKCVSMPWRGLNIRTPFLKEKVKDLRWYNVEDQPDPEVYDFIAVKRLFSSCKFDFEVHTGWISSWESA